MDEARKYSVLVVDDESSNIMALSHILSPKYAVYAAKSGQGALNAAEKYLPDVILLDIIMPEMDGYAVIGALKSSEKTRGIPVIFIAGLNSAGDEEKGLSLGAADYMTKPFSSAIVKLRVQNQIKMLERQRALENDIMKYKLANDALDMMASILNKSDAMIYVTALGTDELLFITDATKRHFGIEGDVAGLPCYKALQKGMTRRCDWCPCHQLDKEPDKAVVWEEHNTLTNRYYRNIDRYVDWPGGKKVHIQYRIDLTDIRYAQEG